MTVPNDHLSTSTGPNRVGRVVGSAGLPLYPTRTDHWAANLINPAGSERFGTKVTFWRSEDSGGPVKAIITSAPVRAGERNYMIIYSLAPGTYPITASVRAESLTFGWHEQAGGVA